MRCSVVPLINLFILATGCGSQTSMTSASSSFESECKQYSEMKFAELGSADDTKRFGEIKEATRQIWQKYPERREEFMRPWLTNPKGDLSRKSIMLNILEKTSWHKDLSETQRRKLEVLISDEIRVEKTNLISTLCQLVVEKKIKSAIPALESAAKVRKDGSNRTKIEAAIKALKS